MNTNHDNQPINHDNQSDNDNQRNSDQHAGQGLDVTVLMDGRIALLDVATDAVVAALPLHQAVGLASIIALTASLNSKAAPDLSDSLAAAADQVHATVAAWDREHYPSPVLWHPDPYRSGRRPWPAVPAEVSAMCDNRSVGVIITDPDGRLLMLQRVRPPVGIAPVAGHVDEHGSPVQAAYAEVWEETGLTVTSLHEVGGWWVSNVCRRRHGLYGPGHDWTLFTAQVSGTVTANPEESRNIRWYTRDEVQALYARTVDHAYGHISEHEFATNPGLEPVWADFLAYTGHLQADPRDLAQVHRLATRSPYQGGGQ
jgi:8-oxo-dGTP pyrophosphatase MutT (NUDIX family)